MGTSSRSGGRHRSPATRPWVGRTAIEIAGAVRARRVTALEVVDDHLGHIAEVDPSVGAFELVDVEGAREAARELDARRDLDELPLAGVPIGLKDVLDVQGLPTGHGSAAGRDELAVADEEVVRRIRAAGAVVVGKTRCPELSAAPVSDNGRGVTRNPRAPGRSAGGSSGGSGAAVASAQVPIAVGSDGGGSIRIPAAVCGTVGLRPGRGRLPQPLADSAHWFGLSQYGPMARTVADVALLLDVMAGARSGTTAPSADLAGLRIGVSTRSAVPGVRTARPFRRGLADAATILARAGAAARPASPPGLWLGPPVVTARSFRAVAAESRRLELEPRAMSPRTRTIIGLAAASTGLRPLEERAVLAFRDRADAFFADHDLLLTPAVAWRAPRLRDWHGHGLARTVLDTMGLAAFTMPWNVADQPCLVVPIDRTEDGLPVAVQVVGRHGREDLVLAVASVLENARVRP